MSGSRLPLLVMAVLGFGSATVEADAISPAAQIPSNLAEQKLDNISLAILIKTAVIAVYQANLTGNYSVLRDLGTPGFRDRYDQAKLTGIFASFRARGINLGPTVMLSPILTRPAEFTPSGQVRLIGVFPTQPLQVQYALIFQQSGGSWLIDGVAVDAIPVKNGNVAQAPPATKNVAANAKQARTPKKTEASAR